MNKLLVLVIIIAAFSSCDGRKTKHESLKDSITKFKDTLGEIENIKYFPEQYNETETDTLLNNGIRVKIKTFTDMEHHVLNTFKQDSITYKHFYRDEISKIEIFKNGTKILSEVIDKQFFFKRDKNLKEYFEIANLTGVWLNDNETISKDKISIYIMFCQPETDNYFLNEMIVNSKGEFSIQKIETE